MPAWSGLWDGVHGAAHAVTGSRPRLQRMISRLIEPHGNSGKRKLQELWLTLNGAAVGQAASATHKQVAADYNVSSHLIRGGARTIETITDVSANTAAADKTDLDLTLDDAFAPSSYPADRSGRSVGDMAGKY